MRPSERSAATRSADAPSARARRRSRTSRWRCARRRGKPRAEGRAGREPPGGTRRPPPQVPRSRRQSGAPEGPRHDRCPEDGRKHARLLERETSLRQGAAHRRQERERLGEDDRTPEDRHLPARDRSEVRLLPGRDVQRPVFVPDGAAPRGRTVDEHAVLERHASEPYSVPGTVRPYRRPRAAFPGACRRPGHGRVGVRRPRRAASPRAPTRR